MDDIAPKFQARCEKKLLSLDIEDVALDGTFVGYASLFDEVDLGNDCVKKGAFKHWLSRHKPSSVRMLYQHDPNEVIGAWTKIQEDEKGLYVEGKLTQGVERADEVLRLLREGALDGLSIGFQTKRAKKDPKTGVRQILEADLWEISIVTFPMLPSARIETIKQAELPTTRTFERWLMRDAGFSRSQAKTIIAKGFANLHGAREAANCQASNRLAETISTAARSIYP